MKPIIDVSHHNGVIDWGKAKSQIEGAIIRVGYRGYGSKGSIIEDKFFTENDNECYRLGIPREYYFFPTDLTVSECAESAIWLCYRLRIYKDIPLHIWLDSEKAEPSGNGRSDKLSKTKRTDMLLTLRDFIQTLYPAWIVGIYASNAWIKDCLDYTVIRENDIPLWIARYNGKKKKPDYPFFYWQYTSSGCLKGLPQAFDFSCRPDPAEEIIN